MEEKNKSGDNASGNSSEKQSLHEWEQEALRMQKQNIGLDAFPSRGPIGQRWARELRNDKKLEADYHSKDKDEKAEFKADWLARKIQHIEVGRNHTRSYKVVNQERYSYF